MLLSGTNTWLINQGAKGAKVDNSGDKLWPMPYHRVTYLVSKSTCWTCWKNWFVHILQTGRYRPLTLERKKWKTWALFKSRWNSFNLSYWDNFFTKVSSVNLKWVFRKNISNFIIQGLYILTKWRISLKKYMRRKFPLFLQKLCFKKKLYLIKTNT